jgi:hypothetical protein
MQQEDATTPPHDPTGGCHEAHFARRIARLSELTPATGERHDEANMAIIDR